MGKRTRVSWNEGLLLTPQHLQLMDRYHDEVAGELFKEAGPFNHGFSELELDHDAVENGQVVVLRGAGVTPAGVAFSCPDRDPVPSGRSLDKHYPAETTSLPFYVGVRVHRSGEPQVAEPKPGLDDVRYHPGLVKVYDETTGDTEREVQVCYSNLRILFPGENLGDYDYLQAGEILRRPEGGYTFREDFVPPCLRVGASPFILKTLHTVKERLVAQSKSLSDRRQHRGMHIAEFSRDDVSSFWLLGVVNGTIPLLTHFLRSKTQHPETVYQALAELAGRLTTMSDLDVQETPVYDHENLSATFGGLRDRIPEVIRDIKPKNFERIPLTQKDETTWVGDLADERQLESSVSFYLGVFSGMATPDLEAKFSDLVKIGPPDQLDFLIANALRGVEVRHVQSIPSSLPIQAGFTYFQVEKSGDVWGLVAGARSIGFYIPPEMPGTKLELIALKG